MQLRTRGNTSSLVKNMVVSKLDVPQLEDAFKRYKIQNFKVPHRKKIPNPFIPHVNRLGLARLILKEVFHYNFKLVDPSYQKALFSRPCIYGVFGGPFGGFMPRKNKCTGCMRCVQEYPTVCRVEDNPEFTKYVDSYWMPGDLSNMGESPYATIMYEAASGKIQVRGMGYKGLFSSSGWDSMWTDMSEIVRPTRDGVYGREIISTQVDLGSRITSLQFAEQESVIKKSVSTSTQSIIKPRVTSINIPIIFDYLPPNLNSISILLSISTAASICDSLFVVTPDQLNNLKSKLKTVQKLKIETESSIALPTHLEKNALLYLNANDIKKLDQIHDIRGILIDLNDIEIIPQIRAENEKIPVFIRCKNGQYTKKQLLEVIKQGIDGLFLVSDYHGKSFDSDQEFIKETIESIHGKLIESGVRDEISIISSGGITLAEHVPKAIICGSDAVAINTTALVALQAIFDTECKIPSKSKISDTVFDGEWGTKRLINIISSWHAQLIEIMSAMGIKDVRRLRGDTGRAMFNDYLEEIAFGGIEYVD